MKGYGIVGFNVPLDTFRRQPSRPITGIVLPKPNIATNKWHTKYLEHLMKNY